MFKDKLFISSTLPYLSHKGHIGHCFEFVLTDVIARYYRLKFGKANVFFNTGVDEHGQKVYQRAIEEGKEPQVFCDEMAEKWKEFCEKFQISYDNFYRTTSNKHKDYAVKFLEQINQYLYTSEYTGLYCNGCESFKTKKELIDGRCEQHPSLNLEEISEENIFFMLKKFASTDISDDILVDDSLENELDNIIKNSEDVSISRSKESVQWGINLPNKDQVIYVWAEALMNYSFAAGFVPGFEQSESFKQWWNDSLIVCGKDNLRFQCLILPALLNAIGIKAPKKVLVHGTILDEKGNKMSKTEGNVIDPIEQLEKFGVSPVRYYLITGLNTFGNSSYSEEELVSKFNTEVVNGYGNLLSRALHLIDIKNIKIVYENNSYKDFIAGIMLSIQDKFESGNLREAYNIVSKSVALINKYITDTKPFSEDCKDAEEILSNVYYFLIRISPYFQIIMPEYIDKINKALQDVKKVILFEKIELTSTSVKT